MTESPNHFPNGMPRLRFLGEQREEKRVNTTEQDRIFAAHLTNLVEGQRQAKPLPASMLRQASEESMTKMFAEQYRIISEAVQFQAAFDKWCRGQDA